MFAVEFSKELTRKMEILKKRNRVMFKVVIKKMTEIKENPEHYKPLKYDWKGYRRVHIMKSFVLVFKINYVENKIVFEDFDHHDNIYRR